MSDQILYRARAFNYAETAANPHFKVSFDEFEVVRKTQCFFVIVLDGKEKKIGMNATKPFAAPTKGKALYDAWRRNKMHRLILGGQLEYAKKVGDFLKQQIDSGL